MEEQLKKMKPVRIDNISFKTLLIYRLKDDSIMTFIRVIFNNHLTTHYISLTLIEGKVEEQDYKPGYIGKKYEVMFNYLSEDYKENPVNAEVLYKANLYWNYRDGELKYNLVFDNENEDKKFYLNLLNSTPEYLNDGWMNFRNVDNYVLLDVKHIVRKLLLHHYGMEDDAYTQYDRQDWEKKYPNVLE